MEYYELDNYGKIYTGKLSAKVMMAVLTSVPKELGFIGTPKFLTKIQGREKYWKGRLARLAEPKGITNTEFVEGIEWNMAFFSSLVATLGKEKAPEAYSKLVEKLAVLQYEDFFPVAKDFKTCPEPWEALRGYFLEFLRTNDRENVMHHEIVRDNDQEFYPQVTYCAVQDLYTEAGHPEVALRVCVANHIFMTKVSQDLRGDFKRERRLCAGDGVCDWHFLRQRRPD
jgi:hypothetical protein